MGIFTNTNIASINGQRNLSNSTLGLQTSLQRLSSGLRINSARDDAAGLQISNRLTSQINGLNQAVRNANDGISLAQTAEGALQESTNILQRIRDLSIQSANASNDATDRRALQAEVSQLQAELQRIAETTRFGGRELLNGNFSSQQFQVGAEANETISVDIGSAAPSAIGSFQITGQPSGTDVGLASAATVLTSFASAAANGNGIEAQNLSISSGTGTASVSVAAGASAATIAADINAVTSTTGVEAEARTQVRLDSLTNAGTVTFTLGNDNTSGTAQTLSATITDTSDLSALANAVNERSATTGITATLDADGAALILEDANGDDIVIGDFTNTGGGTIGAQGLDSDGVADGQPRSLNGAATTGDSIVVTGDLDFISSGGFSVNTDATGTILTDASTVASLSNINGVDISTADGAQDAIRVVDDAIATIDDVRANLGAVQNRFSSTISNLQNVVENVSSARSRIRDTDFAQETAQLTRNQILQQAGVSILAQANQQPQIALSLLGG